MGIRLGVRAPSGRRVRAPRVKNGLISCSWLYLLKVWSLLKIRGDSGPNAKITKENFEKRLSLRHILKNSCGKMIATMATN
jgi:hypothetical protein